MTRLPLIVANWKMHHTVAEGLMFVSRLQKAFYPTDKLEVVLCPPFTALYSIAVALGEDTKIKLGAQNCHFAENGAYTGEISPLFLKELNCSHVILGHSERRHIFGETNADLAKKVAAAVRHGLLPIYCVGETEIQRAQGRTWEIIQNQLQEGLEHLGAAFPGDLIIAYEPVWAIGTGQNATPQQAGEVHQQIRHWITIRAGQSIADSVRILYGGSVKPSNIKSLMSEPNIDGVLVGGASLAVDSFVQIINYGDPK